VNGQAQEVRVTDSFDLLLAVLGTTALLLAIGVSAVRAAPGEPPRARRSPPAAGAASSPGNPGSSPSGSLPAGASIDPDTLELVGVELQGEDGSQVLDWSVLKSYEYREGLAELPDAIRDLEGKPVTMAGFLMPLYEYEDIKEFNLVASHWSCCFGVPPGINGWVHVKLARGQQGLRNSTEPLKITGTFHIAEQKEAGYVVSIFAIGDAKAHVLGW